MSGAMDLTGMSRTGDRNALSLRSFRGDYRSWKMVVEKALVVVGLAGPSSLRFSHPRDLARNQALGRCLGDSCGINPCRSRGSGRAGFA